LHVIKIRGREILQPLIHNIGTLCRRVISFMYHQL